MYPSVCYEKYIISLVCCRIIGKRTFLPIINCDFLRTRYRDLKRIIPQNNMMNVTVEYSPVTLGKLRLVLHVQATMENLKNLGFSDKDVDEVKGIFADTNVYLLGGTFFIAAVHVSTSTDIKVIYYLKNLEFFYKENFFFYS